MTDPIGTPDSTVAAPPPFAFLRRWAFASKRPSVVAALVSGVAVVRGARPDLLTLRFVLFYFAVAGFVGLLIAASEAWVDSRAKAALIGAGAGFVAGVVLDQIIPGQSLTGAWILAPGLWFGLVFGAPAGAIRWRPRRR